MPPLESGRFTFTNQRVPILLTSGHLLGDLLQFYEKGAKSYLHLHNDVL